MGKTISSMAAMLILNPDEWVKGLSRSEKSLESFRSKVSREMGLTVSEMDRRMAQLTNKNYQFMSTKGIAAMQEQSQRQLAEMQTYRRAGEVESVYSQLSPMNMSMYGAAGGAAMAGAWKGVGNSISQANSMLRTFGRGLLVISAAMEGIVIAGKAFQKGSPLTVDFWKEVNKGFQSIPLIGIAAERLTSATGWGINKLFGVGGYDESSSEAVRKREQTNKGIADANDRFIQINEKLTNAISSENEKQKRLWIGNNPIREFILAKEEANTRIKQLEEEHRTMLVGEFTQKQKDATASKYAQLIEAEKRGIRLLYDNMAKEQAERERERAENQRRQEIEDAKEQRNRTFNYFKDIWDRQREANRKAFRGEAQEIINDFKLGFRDAPLRSMETLTMAPSGVATGSHLERLQQDQKNLLQQIRDLIAKRFPGMNQNQFVHVAELK